MLRLLRESNLKMALGTELYIITNIKCVIQSKVTALLSISIVTFIKAEYMVLQMSHNHSLWHNYNSSITEPP